MKVQENGLKKILQQERANQVAVPSFRTHSTQTKERAEWIGVDIDS